ncbi:mannosyltransferase [Frondihabitans australicus]|uniref:Mannosyltransferase n=1 Tax=Frondihabitans australicus TaxID=386892 RepID=A0A495IG05_9MICO|nr:mannosyltransferase [Frondihabitans australicus]
MIRRSAWLLALVAAVVSACGSWIPSLWGDEAASVLSATRPLPSLARMLTHVDAVHGTFYFGLHWWIRIAGTSPFAVRLPDAIAVGLAVVAVVLLVGRLADPATAVVAGLVCLLLPRMTYTGEEARSYAFSAAIAAWLLLLVVDLARGRLRGTRWWIVYGALLALGIYVFLYLALFLAAHALVLAASRARRGAWRAWAVAVVCALVATAPLLVLAMLERSQIASLAGDTTTDFRSLAVGLWFTTSLYAAVAWLLIVVATAFWVVAVIRAVRTPRDADGVSEPGDDPAPRAPRPPSLELVGLAWLVLPGALLLLSNLVVADFTGRYLTMSAPGAALLIAAGLRRLAGLRLPRAVGPASARVPALGVLTALVLASAVPAYLSQRTPYAKNGSDWAEISALVGAHSGGAGAIVFDESAKTSRNPRLALHTYPAGFRGLDDVTLRVPYAENSTWYDATYTVPEALALGRFAGVTTVWLVEYSSGGTTDTSGLADLERAGYRVRETYRTHSSEILRLEK